MPLDGTSDVNTKVKCFCMYSRPWPQTEICKNQFAELIFAFSCLWPRPDMGMGLDGMGISERTSSNSR